MTPFQPDDDLFIEWLAAYVDGELDDARCAQVEAWLKDHPEALADLDYQREFSRNNEELMQAIEPPMPSASEWRAVYGRIENKLAPRPSTRRTRSRPSWYAAPLLAMAGMTFALLIAVATIGQKGSVLTVRSVTPAAPTVASVDDDNTAFEFATADDVEILQLPEEAADLIVVGRHPMLDNPLVLASTSDLDILNLGPDDQGLMPHVDMIPGPNVPMLVAQPLRR